MTPPTPRLLTGLWPVLAVVSVGGALGALARHGLDVLWPPAGSGLSWTILLINVSGSALIGVLMEVLNHRGPHSRFVRPFWGAGVLGGYTTFSAYALNFVSALEHGAPQQALGYLALTLAGAFAGVWASSWIAHRILSERTA